MDLETLKSAPYNFQKVCKIELATKSPKKSKGIPVLTTKRLTFVSLLDRITFYARRNWIYVIVVNGIIVKIGGTAAGLQSRTCSYLAGTQKNRDKGTCATTNYTVYQYLLNACLESKSVEMYASLMDNPKMSVTHWEHTIEEYSPELFQPYETFLMEEFRKQNGEYPILNQKSGNNVENQNKKENRKAKQIK